jgi:hypothetical protein
MAAEKLTVPIVETFERLPNDASDVDIIFVDIWSRDVIAERDASKCIQNVVARRFHEQESRFARVFAQVGAPVRFSQQQREPNRLR